MIKKILVGHGKKNSYGQFGHVTLKLTIFQECIHEMSWFFACKFRRAKSYFNDFWVDMVKSGCSQLFHETPKSQVYELSWFFACWVWCNNFWLDWHCTLSLWLLNKSLLQLYLLDPCQQPERSYEIGSAFPSVLLSVWMFSWNWIIRLLWILAWC